MSVNSTREPILEQGKCQYPSEDWNDIYFRAGYLSC